MPFDPNVPGPHADLTSEMFRGQYNGLKELIDAIPDGPPGPQGPPGPGFNLRGEYVFGTTYQPADVVTWSGNIYLANTATTQPPDVFPDWSLLTIAGPAGPQGAPGEVTTAQLNTAIQTQTSRNCDGVQFLDGSSFSAEGQAIVAKINELLAVLHQPV